MESFYFLQIAIKIKYRLILILQLVQIKDSVSFTEDVSSIIIPKCTPCHQYPGTGGINLDSYENIKLQAQSGQLVQSIIHDTNYVIMPPPPLIGLDSCQIKSIKRWITQGCLNN